MRLIDADKIKFIEYINGDVVVSKQAIQNMPTAYDVDKVIDEFNGAIECCRIEHGDSGVWRFKQAIEIVKSGSVSND